MPIAAVPDYLGDDFGAAAPGHRFYLYFPVWGKTPAGGLEIKADNKKTAVQSILKLKPSHQKTMAALAERQRHIAGAGVWQLPAITIAPLTTGLGMEHPLENGFAFLDPYGLPYLPGSSIKGVLRQAARELIADADEQTDWNKDLIDTLFGPESQDDADARRGALMFWDALPELPGDSLIPEVMTPHQGGYYAGNESPHDSGQPNPILFLAIPPRSKLTFYVDCNRRFLPGGMTDADWQNPLREAFDYAFDWLGFGAKTAVGYGHLEIDTGLLEQQAEERAEREAAAQKQAELAQATADLDAAAAELVRRRANAGDWANNGVFLDAMEAWLETLGDERLSSAAWDIVAKEMASHFDSGILDNPDATKGKKKKPKYSDRQKNLAKALRALKPQDGTA